MVLLLSPKKEEDGGTRPLITLRSAGRGGRRGKVLKPETQAGDRVQHNYAFHVKAVRERERESETSEKLIEDDAADQTGRTRYAKAAAERERERERDYVL